MFDINKSSTAIAAAMVSTIRTGDDALRFASRAAAEGKNSISDLIAFDAVKQARAIRAEIEAQFGPFETVITATSATPTVGGIAPAAEVPALDDFADPKKIFATGATEPDSAPAVGASSAEVPANPLPPAESAAVPGDTTSTNSTTATVSGVEVDSAGLPWDGRIHASSKQFLVKTGEWKLKRGVDPALVEQVNSELRQAMAAGGVGGLDGAYKAGERPTPAASSRPVNDTPETGNALVTAADVSSGTPAENVAKPAINTFADLMRGITANKIEPAYVGEVVKQFGIPSTPVLATRPDLIPQVAAALGL